MVEVCERCTLEREIVAVVLPKADTPELPPMRVCELCALQALALGLSRFVVFIVDNTPGSN